MSHIKIVDGDSLLFRSFYAMYHPGVDVSLLMHTRSGIPTNAIFVFHKFMKKIKADLGADDRLIVCFDTDKKTFRAAKLEKYKMQRKPIEEELKLQLPIAREMLDAMDICHCEMDGYEADDLAGSLTVFAKQRGDTITLLTSDKDYLQLLDDGIEVHFLRSGMKDIEIYTKDNLKEKYGVKPDQVCDYKGMIGDPSDNFSGIPGVGPKTAIKLLETYPHLEEVIVAMAKLDTKTAQNIVAHQEEGRFCKELATMITDLPIESCYLASSNRPYTPEKLLSFYHKYELFSFANELKKNDPQTDDNSEDSARATSFQTAKITTPSILPSMVKKIASVDEVEVKDQLTIVVSYPHTNYHREELEGLYLQVDSQVFFLSATCCSADLALKKLLLSPKLRVLTYDSKALIVALYRLGLEIAAPISFDLLLATYLIDTNVEDDPLSILENYHCTPAADTPLYLAVVTAVSALEKPVQNKLAELGEEQLYSRIELPLARVLANMEIEGVPLDCVTLADYSAICHQKLDTLKTRIEQFAGEGINLNSPRQISTLLYDTLGIRRPDKKGSTANEVLVKLKDQHPIIPLLIEYRKYSKIISSYTDALPHYIFPDQKLHAIFNQALTTTGRLSMKEPNLQNISIRAEEGKEIRKAFFYPDEEFCFLSFDYSQIELRLLAHLADDPTLKEVFNTDSDIHTTTAAKIFGVEPTEVSFAQRRIAKTVNFSIVYGTSAYGLSEKLKISVPAAKTIIESFYRTFDRLRPYEEKVIDFASTNGYVTTLLARRRYLPDINSPSHVIREFSKRAAVNATIQGSAADLIKKAMIDTAAALQGYKTKMILQIHDELIFKVPLDELEAVKPLIRQAMEHAIELSVRLQVEGSAGHSWYDAK